MNTRPTYTQHEPGCRRAVNPCEPPRRRVRVTGWASTKVEVLPAAFDVMQHVSPQAVASITRRSPEPRPATTRGSPTSARVGSILAERPGATRLEQDVFQRKTGPVDDQGPRARS